MDEGKDVFNYQSLLDYCGGQADTAEKVVLAFFKVKDSYIEDMEQAVNNEDVSAVRFICHKIYGSTSVIKAQRVIDTIALIRQSAIDGDYHAARDFFEQMKNELEAFQEKAAEHFPSIKNL